MLSFFGPGNFVGVDVHIVRSGNDSFDSDQVVRNGLATIIDPDRRLVIPCFTKSIYSHVLQSYS
jgi:hypothetical protein